jgi:hypothetical protein
LAILEAAPTGWASKTIVIRSGEEEITRLVITTWKSRGSFTLDGGAFQIEPQGFWQVNAHLKKGSTVIARAEKPSLTKRAFLITSAGHRLMLESRSWSGREYALLLGSQEVGRIEMRGLTGRKIRMEFPDEVPAVLQVFLIYVVLCQASREAAAAAAGS